MFMFLTTFLWPWGRHKALLHDLQVKMYTTTTTTNYPLCLYKMVYVLCKVLTTAGGDDAVAPLVSITSRLWFIPSVKSSQIAGDDAVAPLVLVTRRQEQC